MPVVEIDTDELLTLAGHEDKPEDELIDDLFALGLELEGKTEDGDLELEFAPDRLDRLSVEGIARSLRYQYGDDRGAYVPSVTDPDWTIEVDSDVPDERPYVTGAVLRDVNLDEDALESLIQLQEKLHATMGRGRAKGAIGVHDLTMLKGAVGPTDEEDAAEPNNSVRYTGIAPDGDTFVPLESDREMTPGEALESHHMASEYADLVAEYERMPAIYDDLGLFSFPPAINGRRTEVTAESRNLFVEMTGTDQWTIDRMLAILCYAMDARGATIEAVDVSYADDAGGEYAGTTIERPDLSLDRKTVAHERVESVVGVDFDPDEVLDLLERSGLDAEQIELQRGDAGEEGDVAAGYEVAIPAYRVDVLHAQDLIDDVGRAYGFNELDASYPDVSTLGGRHERSRHERAVRDTLVGVGFEDMLNFHMTNEAETFGRMGLPIPEVGHVDLQAEEMEISGHAGEHADREVADDAVGFAPAPTIATAYSEDYTVLRTWALPSLLQVLEGNTHREYPQDLAEVGFVAQVDPTEPTGVAEHRSVAAVVARHDASYEDARGRLQALASAFDVELETPATEHPSFLDGRVADVVVDGEVAGVIGEVDPAVLVEHDLEVPVAAFELRRDALA
ncbi:phenylalanyl-tRNA ligase subunit beta [Salinarchaeum sp. Harcht-Bsk1]|uniref:phenylalanine--tRNA ligase subunit beta n=1 Tax=Salinarchaeum sp. Harcht-Bsk1 TaxID=1333523 RepID=UPI0003423D53|nr:phenylalanine--tRNA ligase subunit beta [Salinarchaeum sp. Harcht-Bsk1]AGN01664.1 phenylalanyl-tRNA ligase subunit beta [Salinarchaeum sp. Harcht-Bsk1]